MTSENGQKSGSFLSFDRLTPDPHPRPRPSRSSPEPIFDDSTHGEVNARPPPDRPCSQAMSFTILSRASRFLSHRAVRTPTALLMIGLCTTGLGYRAGLDRSHHPTTLRLEEFPDASEFTRCDTFSEIGMLRARLRGLGQRALHELNVVTLRQRTSAHASQDANHAMIAAHWDLVRELRQTPEEEPTLRILLFRLSRAAIHDRWLDLYLDFTCRNPMAPLVSDLQAEAEAFARVCGRESELADRQRLLDQWKASPSKPRSSP